MFELYIEHSNGGEPRFIGEYVSAQNCINRRDALRSYEYPFAYVVKGDEIVSWRAMRSLANKEVYEDEHGAWCTCEGCKVYN